MSDGRHRLSGAEYRKRKAEKEANIKKQAGSLKKFFQQAATVHESASNNVITNHTENTSASTVTSDNVDENPLKTDIDLTNTLASLKDSSNNLISSESKELTLILGTDPAIWPSFLSDKLKTIIVEKGLPFPIDDSFVFPLDDNNRRFTVFNYQRCLSNGENVPRTWLVYSLSKNVIFCYYCKLFSTSKTKLGTDGSNDWRHVSTILKEHETSNSYLRAHQTWIEFSSRLKSKKTIDD